MKIFLHLNDLPPHILKYGFAIAKFLPLAFIVPVDAMVYQPVEGALAQMVRSVVVTRD